MFLKIKRLLLGMPRIALSMWVHDGYLLLNKHCQAVVVQLLFGKYVVYYIYFAEGTLISSEHSIVVHVENFGNSIDNSVFVHNEQ